MADLDFIVAIEVDGEIKPVTISAPDRDRAVMKFLQRFSDVYHGPLWSIPYTENPEFTEEKKGLLTLNIPHNLMVFSFKDQA